MSHQLAESGSIQFCVPYSDGSMEIPVEGLSSGLQLSALVEGRAHVCSVNGVDARVSDIDHALRDFQCCRFRLLTSVEVPDRVAGFTK